MRKVNLIIKRIFDIILSLSGIILFLPFFLIITIGIKFTSKGPVLFRQERLGKSGKVFEIFKFRTMIINAENIGEGLMISDENDPRITKIGKFLRATSLDEIPQLFNVLLGTMSLVGPRPPVTYHPYQKYEGYPEWAKKRFEMYPGITGLSQVTVRNSVPWVERIKVDNEYIEKFNILLDMKILFSTIISVIKKENIYRENKS